MSNRVFCVNCLEHTEYNVKAERVDFDVRGLLVSYTEYRAHCCICDEEVYDAGINDGNTTLRKIAYNDAVKERDCSLSPCPFCGGPAELKRMVHIPKDRGYDYIPRCKDPSCAGRLTKMFNCKETAIYAWERRTKND